MSDTPAENLMDAPAVIYLHTTQSGKVDEFTTWETRRAEMSGTEYVRADLHTALLARAEAAEARADAAEEAHIFADAALAAERETVARLETLLRTVRPYILDIACSWEFEARLLERIDAALTQKEPTDG